MHLMDIGKIIQSNLTRYIEYLGKEITVNIQLGDDMKIKNYYYFFTIINNLITNAVDAILDTSIIDVECKLDKKNYILTVADNGIGIDKALISYAFNPGFTTKYDLKT